MISLVLKQQEQLSKRDDKIKELEQYIDNLLVSIIEDQPSILMTMISLKSVFLIIQSRALLKCVSSSMHMYWAG